MSTVECPCGLVIPLGPADRVPNCPACGHALPARPAPAATLARFPTPVTLFDVADWLAADRHRPHRRGRAWVLVAWAAAAVGVMLAVALSGAVAWLVTSLNRGLKPFAG